MELGRYQGHCPLCETQVEFLIRDAWLRDHFPNYSDLLIHESSPSNRGASDKLFRECPGYSVSQFFQDVPRGSLDPQSGIRCEDLEALSFVDNSVDIFITQDVIEHVFSPEKVFKEISRVLKPGGAHIFTVPLLNKHKPSECWASLDEQGHIVHHHPAEYHGNPIDPNGSLVTMHWGYDILAYIDAAAGTPTRMVTLDDMEQGIRAEYIEVLVSIKKSVPEGTLQSMPSNKKKSGKNMSDDSRILRAQAYQCFGAGDLPGALKLLTSVYVQHGGDAELANDIAVVLHKLGRTDEALLKFREAQALSGEGRSLLADNLLDVLEQQVQAFARQREEYQQQLAAPAVSVAGAYEDFAGKILRQALGLWQNDSAAALHKALRELSDDEWADVLCASVEGRLFDGHILPGFIADETQRMFVGSSGIPALREAQNFIRVVLRYARNNGIAFDAATRAVDFGSGWGRYTRFMLKYIHPDNLYGLEVSSPMVEHCRKSFGMANFIKVESLPPCDLRDNLVDLVFGYSVFSHLAPHCADAWIEEFARIMRPGGLLLMTTQGRSFIDYCRNIRESGNRSHPWYISLSKAFADTEQAYRDYDAGQFLHYGEGQYGGTYGESLIPRGYVEKAWLKDFELVDFVDDRAFLPQALFVLRRR